MRGKCFFIFYEEANFLGTAHILKIAGDYPSLTNFGNVVSARALPPEGTNAIVFFEHSNYGGRMGVLYSSEDYLYYYSFISSVIVIGGSWTVYKGWFYSEYAVRLYDRYYPTLSAIGMSKIVSAKSW